jgi:hypothetical protein
MLVLFLSFFLQASKLLLPFPVPGDEGLMRRCAGRDLVMRYENDELYF